MKPVWAEPAGHLNVLDLGRTRYPEAVELQRRLVEKRRAGAIGDTLLLTEHEPVVTVGRGAGACAGASAGASAWAGAAVCPERLRSRGIALQETSRGGAATYHGPGQLVGYPILSLRERGCDLHRYLADLERALVAAVQGLGARACRREGLRGVWVEERKLVSIGVAVRGWVTWHGFALNVDADLTPFDLIVPCGLPGVKMTNLTTELGRAVARQEVVQAVVAALEREFAATASVG